MRQAISKPPGVIRTGDSFVGGVEFTVGVELLTAFLAFVHKGREETPNDPKLSEFAAAHA